MSEKVLVDDLWEPPVPRPAPKRLEMNENPGESCSNSCGYCGRCTGPNPIFGRKYLQVTGTEGWL